MLEYLLKTQLQCQLSGQYLADLEYMVFRGLNPESASKIGAIYPQDSYSKSGSGSTTIP